MANHMDRRIWLKQTTLALTALGLPPSLAAKSSSFVSSGRPQGQAILLNGNENPYGPSPRARKAMANALLRSNRYPDEAVETLIKTIASHWQVKEENILLGAGSSEIIGLACLHAAKGKGHIITTEPSYRVWSGQATAFGLRIQRNPLPRAGSGNLTSLFGPVSHDTRMIFICNPNNPTGTVLDTKAVASFAAGVPSGTLVLIDEAYTEYANLDTLAALAARHPNIVVAKTFSKMHGLAGARVGYAIAHPQTIKAMAALQPWPNANVSAVSAAAAAASLGDGAFVQHCRDKAAKARELCYATFRQLGLDYIPSSASFVLFHTDKLKANLDAELKQKNIHVQLREHYGGKWCRVSMGTWDEMQAFTAALREIAA